MTAGVTLADPARIDVRGNLKTGSDIFIDINCVFEGDVTLGDNVRIGAGSVVVKSVPADSTVVGIPGRIVRSRSGAALEHGLLPDPEGQDINDMKARVSELESQLHALRQELLLTQGKREK